MNWTYTYEEVRDMLDENGRTASYGDALYLYECSEDIHECDFFEFSRANDICITTKLEGKEFGFEIVVSDGSYGPEYYTTVSDMQFAVIIIVMKEIQDRFDCQHKFLIDFGDDTEDIIYWNPNLLN